MESIGYILTYFANGGLPWQALAANNRSERYNKICEMKLRIPVEQLCYGLPPEFASYINYCRSLRFEDRPDYSHLRKMFKELLVKEGYEYDYAFDWVIMNDKLVNQNVLTMVDNGDDNGESKQSSMVNNDDHDKTGVMQDEDKSEGKPEGEKGSDEEGEDRKEGEGATENSAVKRDDDVGSQVTNGNSLLGGDGGPAESVKKTSIMEKLASQQQKPTKKFLMQGNDGMGDSKEKNILGKKGDKKGAAGAKGKSGGSGGKKKDSGCNNQ